jgi:hypothetical protein
MVYGFLSGEVESRLAIPVAGCEAVTAVATHDRRHPLHLVSPRPGSSTVLPPIGGTTVKSLRRERRVGWWEQGLRGFEIGED